jgi:hypothetical protein
MLHFEQFSQHTICHGSALAEVLNNFQTATQVAPKLSFFV